MKNRKILLTALIFASNVGLAWTHVATNLQGWDTEALSFGVNTENCSVPETELLAVIDEALAAWNGIPNTNLKVSRRTSTASVASILDHSATDTPVIVCDTDITTSVGSADLIPGVAVDIQLNASRAINFGGILLNSEAGAAANIANLSRDQLAIVIAHEIGHILGLGHSSDSKALMYYSISDKTKALITEDDMDGIAHLYPRNELSGKGMMGCSAAHEPGPVRGKNLLVAGLIILGVVAASIALGRKLFHT